MATRPVATSSAPYSGPGSFPGGTSVADQFSRPSQTDQFSRPKAENEEYYRPSKADQSSRPTKPDASSAPYTAQSSYGPPPSGPVPSVSVQPPVEQMAGPAAYPTPQSQAPSMSGVSSRPAAAALTPLVTSPQDMKSVKTSTQFALREYLALQRKRGRQDGASSLELEDRIRAQGGIVLRDLKTLRKEVGNMVKDGENHRWRNWLIGGAVATFIPAVKRIFRKPSDKSETVATNNTEYAFSRSKALVERIKDSVLGRNSFASIAFFVFAVLYVFTNEVSLQVAKTVQKRLKRLSSKIERGDAEVVEGDMKLLEGWRWRVLMWGQ